ncbi:MAG: hypothetical protein NVS9B6_06080 [Candidatus Limnocylindrales bacterium]
MGEGLRILGKVVVHDVADVLDVQPTRGDVGRHEHGKRAVAESIEGPLTLALGEVAVERRDIVAAPLQGLDELVDAPFGVAEDQHLIDLVLLQKLFQDAHLVDIQDLDVDLLDRVNVLVVRLDGDLDRILGEGECEVLHLAGERRAEQRGLPLGRAAAQQPADLGREAHVEQPIGLVEDDDTE